MSSVREKLHCEMNPELALIAWKPESRPESLMFVHGEANVDWVTVWFFDKLER